MADSDMIPGVHAFQTGVSHPRAGACHRAVVPRPWPKSGSLWRPAPMGSVDCWPLASRHCQIPGGKPRPWEPLFVSVSVGGILHLAVVCRSASAPVLGVSDVSCGGPTAGEPSEGKWMVPGEVLVRQWYSRATGHWSWCWFANGTLPWPGRLRSPPFPASKPLPPPPGGG
jgi:hypothetical protein